MNYGLALILIFFSMKVMASPAEERKETQIAILDTIDDLVGNRINHLANDFDAFFATDRADDELGRSRVRYRRQYRVEERAVGVPSSQFRFNLRLPYLEQRFRLEQEDKKKEKQAKTPEERLEILKKRAERNQVDERWLFNADAGVNVSIHPRILTRARLRKSKQTGSLIHRFFQEATWQSNRDGFRQRTGLDTDHKFSDTFLFRFTNLVDWRISQKSFTTTHGPGLFQRLDDYSALSYNFAVGTTVDNSVWYLSGYTLATTYRRSLYKTMVYWDFTPGLSWPKQWSFRRTPFVFTQIEFLFGGGS
jgi:hypothetical protein